MISDRRGFTLVEICVVLGVLGLLLGAALPLASGLVQADRRQQVRRGLDGIASALEAYYFDRAAWPTSLRQTGFLNTYLQSGVGGTAVVDPFAAGADYRYAVSATANTATVYSLGENGIDNGVANEEFVVVVQGAVPGIQHTRQRMRVIVEAIANRLEAGGSVAGSWATLRTQLGLGTEYANDGFGTAFRWTAASLSLTSAGPDKRFGTADDINT